MTSSQPRLSLSGWPPGGALAHSRPLTSATNPPQQGPAPRCTPSRAHRTDSASSRWTLRLCQPSPPPSSTSSSIRIGGPSLALVLTTLFPSSFPPPSAHPWVLQFCALFGGWGSRPPATPLCPALRSRQGPEATAGAPSPPWRGQGPLSCALVKPSGPGVKSSLSHSGFVILSHPQPYQQVRALRRGVRAGGQEGLPRAACASPFAGMEPGWEVELAEHLRLPSSAAPLGRQPLAVPDPVPSPSLPSPSSKATSPSSWMLRRRKSK